MIKRGFILILSLIVSGTAIGQRRLWLATDNIYKELPSSFANLPPDDSIKTDAANNITGINVPLFEAETDVRNTWAMLVTIFKETHYASLVNGISLNAAKIQDFISAKEQGKYYVIYDPQLIGQFNGLPGIDRGYIILFSLGHELGHIINGDIDAHIRSKEREQKADLFACKILCALGRAYPDKIKAVLQTMAGAVPDQMYPDKGERLKAIDEYFAQNLCSDGIETSNLRIGERVWNYFDFDLEQYSNGDPIPQAKNKTDWLQYKEKKIGCWCYYNFDETNKQLYGKYYSWYAIQDKRGLAPVGWHIPTEKEWKLLTGKMQSFEVIAMDRNSYSSKLGLPGTGNIAPRQFTDHFSGVAGFGYSAQFISQDTFGVWWAADKACALIKNLTPPLTQKPYGSPQGSLAMGEYRAFGLAVRFIKDEEPRH